jgi:phage baseplate assembly protein V
MKQLLNIVKLHAIQAVNTRAFTKLGNIVGYDPGMYAVKVAIQPGGNQTGWIPLLTPWAGNGWGMFCAPNLGDMVEVQFQEGDYDAPISCMRFFTDTNRPLKVPAGEFWLVHSTGSMLKFTNDGKVTFTSNTDMNVTVNGNLNAAVTGNITSNAAQWNHTGNMTVTGTLTGTTDVIGGGKSLKTHTHSGVSTGAGNTGAPN